MAFPSKRVMKTNLKGLANPQELMSTHPPITTFFCHEGDDQERLEMYIIFRVSE